MTLIQINPTEHQEQVALFDWRNYAVHRNPKLALLHAIPNGGLRSKATAARMKREGALAGIPDICLPVSQNSYHGLYLELKRPIGGRLSDKQSEIIAMLREEGYRVDICRGFDAAREAIESYLGV